MEMKTTRIADLDHVVAWDDSEQRHVYLDGGDLVFKGNEVVHVGPDYAGPVDTTIEGKGFMAIPGFVNVHSHPFSEPANKGLTSEQVDARAHACFWPYHQEVDRQLDRMTTDGRRICLLVVHSFTPEMKGFERPWHVGVLWSDDPRLPEPLLAELRKDASLVVGDNEPYSAREPYEYTLTAHARPRALPHCSLEVRQDLMGRPDDARKWGRKLAEPIRAAVAAALA